MEADIFDKTLPTFYSTFTKVYIDKGKVTEQLVQVVHQTTTRYFTRVKNDLEQEWDVMTNRLSR